MPLRRAVLPDALRRAVELAPGDRILASAELVDGYWGVATRRQLAVLDADARMIAGGPWCDVDRAAFDPVTGTVAISWVEGQAPTAMEIANPKRLALVQTVRERVQWSVVLSESVEIGPERYVKVAVRRDGDGSLFSQVVADEGVDLDNPEIAAKVDAAELRVRSASGLPR